MNNKQTDIIERAGQVFMKLGIRSVTMKDVADHLGVSKKTLYNHFKDKDELIRKIIKAKIELDIAVFKTASTKSPNAIEELHMHSKYVIETFKAINPSVFHDLKKSYPEAWKDIYKHKWDFVYHTILRNINRGITEGLYRNDIHKEIYAKMYVSNVETVIEGEIFPWPEFKYEVVFMETFRLHIRGLANEKGLNYFQEKILNY
tara:strand:+ start:552 stop:1160 length:609 start_codon:yes stop_codon:yes gene_type:complete